MASTIHIHRGKARWKDRLRAYKIMVDGAEAADVRNGETVSFELPPGQHEIYAKIDWTRSNSVAVTISEGEVIHLGVANNVKMWKFATGVKGVVQVLASEKDSYLKLGPVEPPF